MQKIIIFLAYLMTIGCSKSPKLLIHISNKQFSVNKNYNYKIDQGQEKVDNFIDEKIIINIRNLENKRVTFQLEESSIDVYSNFIYKQDPLSFNHNEYIYIMFYDNYGKVIGLNQPFINYDRIDLDSLYLEERKKASLKYENYLKTNNLNYTARNIEEGWRDFSSIKMVDPFEELSLKIDFQLPQVFPKQYISAYVSTLENDDNRYLSDVKICLVNDPKHFSDKVLLDSNDKNFFKGKLCSSKIPLIYELNK